MSPSPSAPGSAPYALLHGASWLTPTGEIVPIPGFHEEWLREHEDIAQGARNACELILRKRWISVTLYSEGYLELMVPERRSPEVLRSLHLLLSRNADKWSKALVMAMDQEGYSMLEPGDAMDEETLRSKLKVSL